MSKRCTDFLSSSTAPELSLKLEIMQLPVLTELALQLVLLVRERDERVSEWGRFVGDYY
jgi:hypothetical protein